MEQIILYSKKSGVNQLLFIANDLMAGMDVIDEKFREHKPFAYALVKDYEIKLFNDIEIANQKVSY